MESLTCFEKEFKAAFEIDSNYKTAFSLLSNTNIISFLLFSHKNMFPLDDDIVKEMISNEVHNKNLSIETKQVKSKIIENEFLENYIFPDFKNEHNTENDNNISKSTFIDNLENLNSSNNSYFCLEKINHSRNGVDFKISINLLNTNNDNGQTCEEFLNFGSNSSSENGNEYSQNIKEPENTICPLNYEENNGKVNKSAEMFFFIKLSRITNISCLLLLQVDSNSFKNYSNICSKLFQNTHIKEFDKVLFSNHNILNNSHLYSVKEIKNSIIVRMKEKELFNFVKNEYSLKYCSNEIASKEYEKINLNEDDSVCFDFFANFEDKSKIISLNSFSPSNKSLESNNNCSPKETNQKSLNSNESLDTLKFTYNNHTTSNFSFSLYKDDKLNYNKYYDLNSTSTIDSFNKFFMCFNFKKIGLSFTLLKMTVELDYDKKDDELFDHINTWSSNTLKEIYRLTSS